MSKKFTILLIPEGADKVKRFRIPRLVPVVFIIMLVGALSLAGYWYKEYNTIRRDLPSLCSLEKQNQRQEAQIKVFEKNLAAMTEQMSRLKSFNSRLRVLANLKEPDAQASIFGVGGPTGDEGGGAGVRLTTSSRERRLMAMRRTLDQLSAEGESQRLVQEELAKFLKERRSILASTPSIWPVRGWVTSGFGSRVSPFTGKRQFHSGLDISTRVGTKIKAPANGVVTFAGREGGFGKLLVINHGHGIVTRYGHLHAYKVKVGQQIKRGDVIALVGNTGRSTGPHLHYEVMLSGVPTNPRYYILD